MKNIHLIPTEKPSRLVKNINNELKLTIQTLPKDDEIGCYPQHIYITSNEKYNVRDEYVTDGIEVIKATPKLVNAQGLVSRRNWRKIILTTNQDLINDGVQAIDDEFLEWFVKNSSCEYVKLKDSKTVKEHIWDGTNDGEIIWEKEIIIPQEESKQETLEEAAENAFNILQKENPIVPDNHIWPFKLGYLKGAIWQAERMYSEEDMIEFAKYCNLKDDLSVRELLVIWFEQFKKK
jgi:hypothetical protein